MGPPIAASPIDVDVFVVDFVGGVTAMMSRWIDLSRDRVAASVVVVGRAQPSKAPLAEMFPRGIRRVSFDPKLDNRKRAYDSASRLIASPESIIVANDLFELGMVAALRLPNPIAFVLHGDYDYYYELAVRHSRDIRSFLCVSAAIERRLSEMLPHRARDIHLTHPIVNDPAQTRTRENRVRELKAVFVGRLTEEKGFFDLPTIDSAVVSLGCSIDWTVVGQPESELPASARTWLGEKRVTHLPHVPADAMESVYAANDVLVFPSRREGFGMCVLEAMKSGLVPIASRLEAGIPEMIDHGVTGFVADVGDCETMAGHIAMLAQKPNLMSEMGSAARASALSRFDSRTAADRITMAVAGARSAKRRGPVPPDYLSRLDKRWLPNIGVRAFRKAMRLQRENAASGSAGRPGV